MARIVKLMPDYGPHFGRLDDQAITSTDQLPVSQRLRADIERWWQLGYGDTHPEPDLDDEGYEALTHDLAARLQEELGPDWSVTWEL